MPARVLAGAMCVQRFDDSLTSAIRITYRISLRSSSMPEPRDPLLKVVICLYHFAFRKDAPQNKSKKDSWFGSPAGAMVPGHAAKPGAVPAEATVQVRFTEGFGEESPREGGEQLGNDPSAGSPTETLLRLLLPLNDRVWRTFRP